MGNRQSIPAMKRCADRTGCGATMQQRTDGRVETGDVGLPATRPSPGRATCTTAAASPGWRTNR
jgi:hypothetical protein